MLLANNCRRICKSSFIVLLVRLSLFQSWSRWLWNINLHSQHIRQGKLCMWLSVVFKDVVGNLEQVWIMGQRHFGWQNIRKGWRIRKVEECSLCMMAVHMVNFLKWHKKIMIWTKKIEKMVLTYSLPDVILQQMTPNRQILLLCMSWMIDKCGTWSSYLWHTLYAFVYQASTKYTINFWIDYMLGNKCRRLCKSTNVDCSWSLRRKFY